MQNKQEQWTVLKRLMSYLKPYGLLTFLALSFLLATTVIKSVIPLVASHFIDQYLSNLNRLAVTVLLVYYGLYILQTLVQYVGNLLFARVSYSIVRDIRRDAFANMEKLGMSYFDKTPAGSIVSRLTNDTETISDMFSGILSSFISAVFIFLTTLYLSDNPLYHVGAGFSFDGFSLALSSFDFPFGQSLSKKVSENHRENQKSLVRYQ